MLFNFHSSHSFIPLQFSYPYLFVMWWYCERMLEVSELWREEVYKKPRANNDDDSFVWSPSENENEKFVKDRKSAQLLKSLGKWDGIIVGIIILAGGFGYNNCWFVEIQLKINFVLSVSGILILLYYYYLFKRAWKKVKKWMILWGR